MQAVLEKIPDGILVLVEDTIVYCNPALSDMLHHETDEILSMPILEVFHADERVQVVDRIADVFGGGYEHSSEHRIISRDGHEIPTEVFIHRIEYIGGQMGLLFVFQNLTVDRRVEEALGEFEERYQTLVEYAPEAIVVYDMDVDRFVDVNENAVLLFGLEPDVFFQTSFDQICPGMQPDGSDSSELIGEKLRQVLTGDQIVFEITLLNAQGVQFPCEVRFVRLPAAGRRLIRGSLTDITERKEAEIALKESEERYALAARGANDGLWDWNILDGEIYFSPRWKAMLGYREEEITNLSTEWFQRVHDDDLPMLEKAISDHFAGDTPHFEAEYRILHADESYRWMLCRGLAIRDADGRVCRMAGSQTDITQRKKAEEQLRHDAIHDALTGLPNRNYFMEELSAAVERVQNGEEISFGVLFLDLDRFKSINDSFGHLVGDKLLVKIARRLQLCLPSGDIVARFGGDEFAFLLYFQNDDQLLQIVECIEKQITTSFTLEGHELFIDVSIGVVLSSLEYLQPEHILRDADTAMYYAKRRPNIQHAIFNKDMQVHTVDSLRFETNLRKALEREEFLIYYQPIISIDTRRICGLEALVRWQHPDRGLVLPAEFIPLAEELGVLGSIQHWVLETACKQFKEWEEQGLFPGRLVINLSMQQFTRANLASEVEQVLTDVGLQPEKLELEIAETVFVETVDTTLAVQETLKELGVRLSIDDFGMFYSAFSYLKLLPVDGLKIAKDFIDDVVEDPYSAEISKTIISLARGLELNVVAEGVETKKQLGFLCEYGCREVQGSLFSEPVPQVRVTEILRSNDFGMLL